MADLNVSAINLTQAEISGIATDVTQVEIRISYDSTPTAGWSIVAQGPLGSYTICPKPCGSQVG